MLKTIQALKSDKRHVKDKTTLKDKSDKTSVKYQTSINDKRSLKGKISLTPTLLMGKITQGFQRLGMSF